MCFSASYPLPFLHWALFTPSASPLFTPHLNLSSGHMILGQATLIFIATYNIRRMGTLKFLQGACTHAMTQSTQADAQKERRDLPKVAQPDSKQAAEAHSQLPPEFLLSSWSCVRSPTGPRPRPDRASCSLGPLPARPLRLAGGRSARSPDLTAPPRKKPARPAPGLRRLTSLARCLGNGKRDFRLLGKPRLLPPVANVAPGGGPCPGEGHGAGGGARRERRGPPDCRAPHLRALLTVPPGGLSLSGYHDQRGKAPPTGSPRYIQRML